MATTFPGFPRLPGELRDKIWKECLPSQTPALGGELVARILSFKHQDGFWRGSSRPQRLPKRHIPFTWRPSPRAQPQKKAVHELQQETTPPYQRLAACIESRILALKQVKKELENDPQLAKWLKNPPFPFRPKLELDTATGSLIYTCPQIVENYHLEKLVFRDTSTPLTSPSTRPRQSDPTPTTNPALTLTTPATTPTSTQRPLTKEVEEEEEEADWNPDNPIYFAEKDNDAIWSDNEEEPPHKRQKQS